MATPQMPPKVSSRETGFVISASRFQNFCRFISVTIPYPTLDVQVICFLLFTTLFAIEPDESAQKSTFNLIGVKCVVSGRQVSPKHSTNYKKGKVFFDCNSSRLQFERNRQPFVSKANHQLLVTSQYGQTHCPFKPVPVSMGDSSVLIAGVRIRFCCGSCLAKLNLKGTSERKIEFLFSDKIFDHAFSLIPKATKQSGPAKKIEWR